MFSRALTNPYFTPLALLTLGLAPLCAAWFSQYALGYPPCHLCMLQRYPYAVIAALGGFSLVFPAIRARAKPLWQLTALCCATTAAVAAYHVGIEQGWIIENGGCSSPQIASATSIDAMRAQLLSAPLVACNEVSLRVFGLSMASYNVIMGLVFAASTLYISGRITRKTR